MLGLAPSLTIFIHFLEAYSHEEPLQCNYCIHSRKKKDQLDGVNQNPDCMNHLKFGSRMDLRRQCAANEKFCISTVTNLNGFFVTIDRDCAAFCKEGCEEHGYGLFYTQCTRCCSDPLCNDYDGAHYYRPKSSKHLVDWFFIGITIFAILHSPQCFR